MYYPRGNEMLTNRNQTPGVVTNEKPRNKEFLRWPITRCFIKNDRAGLIIEHSTNFRLNANIDRPCNFNDL